MVGQATDGSDLIWPLPPRLVTDEDLKQFYEAMKISDVPKGGVESNGVKRKSGYLGGLDTQQYGRGKRAREVGLDIVFFWMWTVVFLTLYEYALHHRTYILYLSLSSVNLVIY